MLGRIRSVLASFAPSRSVQVDVRMLVAVDDVSFSYEGFVGHPVID